MPSYPNRCQHIKINGTQCGSPALRRNRFCYFHKRHHDERVELNADRAKTARARRRTAAIDLPVLEDADSIQISLMQIMRLLISGDLDAKVAGLVLYALQTASSNLHRTRFEPSMYDVILDPASVAETPLGEYVWEDEDFIDENEADEDDEENDEEDDGVDPARRAGILKAAEYLYELDRKNGGIHGFAPKPTPATAPATKPNGQTDLQSHNRASAQTTPDATAKKPPARELTTAEVRQQVREVIVKRAPALLAANPDLISRLKQETDVSP